jgi:hypothetical protein
MIFMSWWKYHLTLKAKTKNKITKGQYNNYIIVMNTNLCLQSVLDNCINIQVRILYLKKKIEIAGQMRYVSYTFLF